MNPVLVMEKGSGCKVLDVRIGLWSLSTRNFLLLQFRIFIQPRVS
jgi:hypothetical protein